MKGKVIFIIIGILIGAIITSGVFLLMGKNNKMPNTKSIQRDGKGSEGQMITIQAGETQMLDGQDYQDMKFEAAEN